MSYTLKTVAATNLKLPLLRINLSEINESELMPMEMKGTGLCCCAVKTQAGRQTSLRNT